MLKYLTFIPCLLATLTANIGFAQIGEPQEIRVQLATNTPLSPLYLGRLQCERSTLDNNYINQLEATLEFDFNYNGSTRAMPHNEQKDQLLLKKDPTAAFNPQSWKTLGVAYVVKGQITENNLTFTVLSVNSGSVKHFKDIPLSGQIGEDKRQIHKAVDAIYKALFDEDGVANTRILYSVQTMNSKQEWSSEIWECDWDGGNARQITHDNSYCVTPVFIPSKAGYANNRFLYVSYKQGQPKIFIASLKEGVGKRFVDLRGNQLLPAISPQRDKIAFICDASGRTDLFVQPFHPEMGEIGKPIQLFSYPRSTQASPTFNHDGSKVAFVSDKDGSPRVYIIPTDAAGKRATATLITKQNPESSCPSWSPDGSKLAYSAKTKGVRQIWIYDFATKEERQLTDGPGNKENPTWAPNSRHIVFNSVDAGSSELFIVNLNQPEAVKITRGTGKKHYPTWGAR